MFKIGHEKERHKNTTTEKSKIFKFFSCWTCIANDTYIHTNTIDYEMNTCVSLCVCVYLYETLFRIPIAYVNVSRVLVYGLWNRIHVHADTHTQASDWNVGSMWTLKRWRANAKHIHNTHRGTLTHFYEKKMKKKDTPNKTWRGTHNIIYTRVYSCM